MKLEGKTAIVTGAAQGLGEAIANRLAREGADVVLADMNAEKAAAAAEKIAGETGRRAMGMQADITNPQDCAAMVTAAVKAFGKLDILVANAGILKAADITEFELTDWKKSDRCQSDRILPFRSGSGASDDIAGFGKHCADQFQKREKGKLP